MLAPRRRGGLDQYSLAEGPPALGIQRGGHVMPCPYGASIGVVRSFTYLCQEGAGGEASRKLARLDGDGRGVGEVLVARVEVGVLGVAAVD